MKKKIFRFTGLIAVFLLAFVVLANAQRRDDSRDDRRHEKEKRIEARHDDYRDISVRDRHYFYREGNFYDKRHEGYVKIAAPIGARIDVLPHGYRMVKIHRANYYKFGGVYYKFLQREKVYEVVEFPR